MSDYPDKCQRCGEGLPYDDIPTPCVDSAGQRYEHVTDSEPGTRLWCPDCWDERETERRASENKSIVEFGGGSA